MTPADPRIGANGDILVQPPITERFHAVSFKVCFLANSGRTRIAEGALIRQPQTEANDFPGALSSNLGDLLHGTGQLSRDQTPNSVDGFEMPGARGAGPKPRISKQQLLEDAERLAMHDLVTSLTKDIKSKVVHAIVKDALDAESNARWSADNLDAGEDGQQRDGTEQSSKPGALQKLLGDSNRDLHRKTDSERRSTGLYQPTGSTKQLMSFNKLGSSMAKGWQRDATDVWESPTNPPGSAAFTSSADEVPSAEMLYRKRKRTVHLDLGGLFLSRIDWAIAPPPRKRRATDKPLRDASLVDEDMSLADRMLQIVDLVENLDADKDLEERVRSALRGMRGRRKALLQKQHVMDIWRNSMSVSSHEELSGKEPVCKELSDFPGMVGGDDEDTEFAEQVLSAWVTAYESGERSPLSEFNAFTELWFYLLIPRSLLQLGWQH